MGSLGLNEHGGTRTPDTQNRNLMLYPTELHAQPVPDTREEGWATNGRLAAPAAAPA